ncbi:MAG TPA: transposase [candidate division Zixibacteria bacterium]|nr:transposase [candidate division Zixibacteria bacterium]
MFKKSSESIQQNLFTSGTSLFSGKSQKLYEDELAWHNQFRKQVTMRINESLFSPLYCSNNGSPNASIRVLVAMMILKEAQGLSDQKIYEDCRFNMLTRGALGLLNADDPVPTESTYYLFRKKVNDYSKAGNGNLFELSFSEITKSQCAEFNVSGKRIRMDSKLLGSNIAWLSRYELIHETLRVFYKGIKQTSIFDKATKEKLDKLLKIEGNKIVYTCSSEEVKTKLQELGVLIHEILPLFPDSANPHYLTLQKVFNEQFKVDENKIVVSKEKEEISAKSIQSPHDTDCHYRDKDGNKVKGYSTNITESCDDGDGLNLIGNVDVRNVSTSDVDFFQDDINSTREVFTEKPTAVHADGAYHSPDNQAFCKDNDIDLYLHAIQGTKGRYKFGFLENGELTVLDTKTGEFVETTRITGKNNIEKWRIKNEKAYRYFTQKEIDTYMIRKKIAETPIEILQKRNNVEATIFQLGYHYPNAKSRYRGLIKHQMWANIRCLWVNFVRILKYIKQLRLKNNFFAKYLIKPILFELYMAFKLFLKALLPNHILSAKNIAF